MNIGATHLTPHRLLAAMAAIGLATVALSQAWNYTRPLKLHHDGRPNPWRGLPGCIYLAGEDPEAPPIYRPEGIAMRLSCEAALGHAAQPASRLADPGASVRNAVQPWLATPVTASPVDSSQSRGLVANVPGRGLVRKGADVALTIAPTAQARAQLVLNCMTGQKDDCRTADIDVTRWQSLHEGAAARSIAMVQVDIATGAIDVLASARSSCFEADARGKSGAERPADCPMLSHAMTPRADWLGDLALDQYAMPGSINKPWMMLSILRAGKNHFDPGIESEVRWLEHTLRTSDTPALLDRLLCRKQGYAHPCPPQDKLWSTAVDLGLDGTSHDILLGGTQGGLMLPAGRIYQQAVHSPGKVIWQPIPSQPIPADLAQECASRGWEICRGDYLARVLSELWGAGSSAASPVAVASAYARLAQAANDQRDTPPIHLVARVETGKGIQLPEPATRRVIDPVHARLILGGLSQTHLSGESQGRKWTGTTHSACAAVFGATPCNGMRNMASKTGTPGLRHDQLKWPDRLAHCTQVDAQIAQADANATRPAPALRAEQARCKAVPYKWVAMLSKASSNPDAPYTKAIVILSERNWYRDGFVDSKDDRGSPNISAEVAFRYLKGLPGFLAEAKQEPVGSPK